jgi:hypothetical protein
VLPWSHLLPYLYNYTTPYDLGQQESITSLKIEGPLLSKKQRRATIQMTPDIYSHFMLRLQQVAAESFGTPLNCYAKNERVEGHHWQIIDNIVKISPAVFRI